MNIEAVANQTPKPARRFQHRDDRDCPERNEVQGAIVGEKEPQREKDQRADDWPLYAADPADDHNKYDVGRPVCDAECRRGRDPQLLKNDQASDQSGNQRGDEIDG